MYEEPPPSQTVCCALLPLFVQTKAATAAEEEAFGDVNTTYLL